MLVLDCVFDGMTTVLGVGTFALFAWAIRYHFVVTVMPFGMIVLSLLGTAAAIILLLITWLLPQPGIAQLAGMIAIVAAALLFVAAIAATSGAGLPIAFSNGSPAALIGAGPYRWIRHPFYASYSLFWLGWGTAAWSPIVLLPLGVLLPLYFWLALREERQIRRSSLGPNYLEYSRRTGFMLPKLLRDRGNR